MLDADLRGGESGGALPDRGPAAHPDITQAGRPFWNMKARYENRVEVGVVSAAGLRHKVPKQATKANKRGIKLAKSGKHQEAANTLEQALAYDPEFASAHNNLAVQYVLLLRQADARRELLLAIELDPALEGAFLNLARLELQSGDPIAAEQYAQRASRLSGRNLH
ncbi:MAG: tetratricopeptide repeat protein [Acidobacteriota bacterium]